ncbi:creatininase family protein [Bacillus sp. APMAM]|nr:creatininase family protein [Bacillus sp. APMAM]
MTTFKKVKESVNTIILPIGMVEAHGPHCSLATDILIPREFLKRLDTIIGEKVIIAPEISYGHSWENSPFPGTISLSNEVFSNYVYEIARGFFKQGFKNIVLFNGHGGNQSGLKNVSERIAELGGVVLTINWWVDYREEIKTIVENPGHAGEDETSLMLAINQKYADISLVGHHEVTLPRNIVFKDWGKSAFPEAYFGNAGAATAEKGEKIYELLLPIMLKEFENLWSINQR